MNDEERKLAEEHQERMCDLCERKILGCSAMSSTFMCEGSRCEDAFELLLEELDEEKRDENDRLMYVLIK